MESQRWKSRGLAWASVSGWAIGLGLVTSWLVDQTDREHAGVMLAAACATLMWRIVVTIGMPELAREAPDGSPAVQQPPFDQQPLSS
jgi:hypothetical protein